MGAGQFLMGRSLQEVWIEYYLWIPGNRPDIGSFQDFAHRDNPGHADNNKWFRLWAGGDDAEAWLLWMANKGPALGSTQYQTRWSDGGPGSHHAQDTEFVDVRSFSGQWIRHRIHAKVASAAGATDGLVEMWWNDHKFVDRQNIDMYFGGLGFDAGHFMGWHNSGYDQQVKFYIDDVAFFDSDPRW